VRSLVMNRKLIICLLSAFFVVACNGKTQPDDKAAGKQNASPEASSKPAPEAKEQKADTAKLYKFEKDGKTGYIDNTGKVVIEPKFTYGGDFEEGMATITEGEKVGYIDKTGNVVVKPQYEEAGAFSEGLAYVYTNKKYGFIDKTGKM